MLRQNDTVALYGDSMMDQCSNYIKFFLGLRDQNITTITKYFPGTALCDALPDLASGKVKPSLAVFLFTGNMLTPCTQGRHLIEPDLTKRMLGVYVDDMTAAMDYCNFFHVPAAWVMPPAPVGEPAQSHPLVPYYSWIASVKGQRWIDADRSPAGDVIQDGVYVKQTGDGKQVRADDNRHFAPDGAMRFANAICTVI